MTLSPRTLAHRALALVALLALCAAAVAAGAETEVPADADKSRPFVVKVHADWCGTCTKLNPTWEEMQVKIGDDARFVIFDLTDKQAVLHSRAEAERLGLTPFLTRHKRSTGTIAVLDGASREPVIVLRGDTDVAKYEEAVARAREKS
jgi:thiol-disulfide isomerase/thioredoxin